MAQKQALEDDATATQRKMDSANALINALAGEESRWTQQSKEFDDTIQRLTGGVAVQQVCVSRRGLLDFCSFLMLLSTQSYLAACCWMCCAWQVRYISHVFLAEPVSSVSGAAETHIHRLECHASETGCSCMSHGQLGQLASPATPKMPEQGSKAGVLSVQATVPLPAALCPTWAPSTRSSGTC